MPAVIKTTQEIEMMKEGGVMTASIIQDLLDAAQAGVTTLQLEELAVEKLASLGVSGSFNGYEGYPYNVVSCVNDVVVHGMPNNEQLQNQDVLTIDFGVLHKGFHTDSARTKIIGESNPVLDDFLKHGEGALYSAIDQCVVGNRIGDVSDTIQSIVESHGYSVIRAFVGHGVGRELHEDPSVPGYGTAGTGPLLKAGMVIAVEVMYTKGGFEVFVEDDDWTVKTLDGSLASMFEHTVAITNDGPIIITRK